MDNLKLIPLSRPELKNCGGNPILKKLLKMALRKLAASPTLGPGGGSGTEEQYDYDESDYTDGFA